MEHLEENIYGKGDTVWYLEAGKAKKGTVVDFRPDDNSYEYEVEGDDGGITLLDEYELFAVAESLIRDIFEDFEVDDICIDILY